MTEKPAPMAEADASLEERSIEERLAASPAAPVERFDAFEELIDESPSSVLIYDDDARILYANAVWLARWGVSLDDVRGRSLLEMGSESEKAEFAERLEMLRTLTPENPVLAHEFAPPMPGVAWISVVFKAWFDADGRVTHYSVIGRNRTEWWLAQTESERVASRLAERNRDLESFAANASHDLREPLRKIRTFAGRLSTTNADRLDDRGRDYLERIEASTVRMQQLVTDVLTFARAAAPLEAERDVDLAELIEGVLIDLELAVEETGAEVVIDELPTVRGDGAQLRQVFQNLIGNALKFRAPDRPLRIEISAEQSPRQDTEADVSDLVAGQMGWAIHVADNGIGFDSKHEDAVFEVFQRLHPRTTYEGSGIGLSLCRRIIERHDGELTARSTLGSGATFTVWLA